MSKNDSKSGISTYCWLILALSFTSFFMSFSTRYTWPPLMPVVMPILGISLTQGMFYMTAFFVGYVGMQIPGGILTDKYGARRVLAITLFVQGVCTCLLSLTDSYTLGLLLRGCTGLAGGSVFSASFKAVVTWFPPHKRAMAIGVLLAAPSVGVAIPNIVVPKLNTVLGWQGSFLAVGLTAVVVSVVLFAVMRDAPLQSSGPRKSFMVGVRFVLSNRNMRLITMADFWIIFIQLGFYSLANTYMVDRLMLVNDGLERNTAVIQAGVVMFYVGIVGMVMPAFSGWLAGVTSKPTWNFIGGALLLIPALVLFGMAESYSMWLVCGTIFGGILAFVNPMFSVVVAENAGPDWAATAGGIGNCWLQFGGMLGPLAMGLARDWSGAYTACWVVLCVAALLAAVICLLVGKPPSAEEREGMIVRAAAKSA